MGTGVEKLKEIDAANLKSITRFLFAFFLSLVKGQGSHVSEDEGQSLLPQQYQETLHQKLPRSMHLLFSRCK